MGVSTPARTSSRHPIPYPCYNSTPTQPKRILMPSKYSDQQKAEAMQMLEIGDHIGYVHFATGIPRAHTARLA